MIRVDLKGTYKVGKYHFFVPIEDVLYVALNCGQRNRYNGSISTEEHFHKITLVILL